MEEAGPFRGQRPGPQVSHGSSRGNRSGPGAQAETGRPARNRGGAGGVYRTSRSGRPGPPACGLETQGSIMAGQGSPPHASRAPRVFPEPGGLRMGTLFPRDASDRGPSALHSGIHENSGRVCRTNGGTRSEGGGGRRGDFQRAHRRQHGSSDFSGHVRGLCPSKL